MFCVLISFLFRVHPNTDHILIGRYRELVDEAVGFINIILEVSEVFHDWTISLIYVGKEVTKPLDYFVETKGQPSRLLIIYERWNNCRVVK